MTPATPRPPAAVTTMTCTELAVAQNTVHTSGTALTWFSTLTGKPSPSMITKQCPAPIASAARTARRVSSASFPDRRTSRACDASQNATPNRSWLLTPASVSCRSSTVLMKCAWPTMTLTSAGLSTGTTSNPVTVAGMTAPP